LGPQVPPTIITLLALKWDITQRTNGRPLCASLEEIRAIKYCSNVIAACAEGLSWGRNGKADFNLDVAKKLAHELGIKTWECSVVNALFLGGCPQTQ
jgi:hypothetical protein